MAAGRRAASTDRAADRSTRVAACFATNLASMRNTRTQRGQRVTRRATGSAANGQVEPRAGVVGVALSDGAHAGQLDAVEPDTGQPDAPDTGQPDPDAPETGQLDPEAPDLDASECAFPACAHAAGSRVRGGTSTRCLSETTRRIFPLITRSSPSLFGGE